jgi:hypothetical protein
MAATVKELRETIKAHPNHAADAKGIHRTHKGTLVSKAKRDELVAYCEHLDDQHVQEVPTPKIDELPFNTLVPCNRREASFILRGMTKGQARKQRKAWQAMGLTWAASAPRNIIESLPEMLGEVEPPQYSQVA